MECEGNRSVVESSESAVAKLDREVIGLSLNCRRCGYNLRGLKVGGKCPECGLDAWETVLSVVDPAASRLPLLRDPKGVGAALVWLISCLVAATALQLSRPVALRLDGFFSSGEFVASRWTPHSFMLLAGCVVLAGLWSVWKLAPLKENGSRGVVWRDIDLLAGGLLVWGALSIVGWFYHAPMGVSEPASDGEAARTAFHLAGIGAAGLILVGLKNVLRVIGERSREYRSARGGRQRVRDMIAGAIGMAAGQILQLTGSVFEVEAVRLVGTVVTWISALMLVIGLLYLLANAWWIRRALRKPPPSLRELFAPAGSENVGDDGGRGNQQGMGQGGD